MATSLNTSLDCKLNWQFESSEDLSTPKDENKLRYQLAMSNGSTAGAVEQMYRGRLSLTVASPTQSLDLSGGLTNVFGTSIALTKVRELMIYNRGVPDGSGGWTETAGENLLVGGAGAAANAWNAPFNADDDAKLLIPAGGMVCMAGPQDGWSVTDGADDVLKFELSGLGTNGIEVDVVIVGIE